MKLEETGLIEAKPPYFNVFDEEELKEPARKKANKRKAKYFATTNFKKLLWFSTERANNTIQYNDEEQLIEKYDLSEINNLDYIEQAKYKDEIVKVIEDFLIQLIEIHTGKKQEPKHPIDEFLIFRFQEKIRILSYYYRQLIEDQCHKDNGFRKQLGKWFFEQGWNFVGQENDFDKAARQTAYLLINKILFYGVLQSNRPERLDPLEIPESLTHSSLLASYLQAYFKQVLDIDYQSIYDTDFIDTVAFPDSKEVVNEIKELVKVLKKYDFSKIGYDIIGSLFERLIPIAERHILGQYFTKADIVDLILRFCLHHEEDKVIDPACGAGTFLVRAYHHKSLMNDRLEHEKILSTLWGVDIAKFPAHLSQINLAIKKLESNTNYPNIIKDDFFTMLVGPEGFEPAEWRKKISKTLSAKERTIEHPRWFDVLVGNPPYTRQEEIEGISEKERSYKNRIIQNSLKDDKGRTIVKIGKRAGIHAYFFVHGTKFLKDGGYFGFIVSNSWLDSDYGKGLQELFLKYYKIVAIIESKIERWFEEADVNTCIVILQKCNNRNERDRNLVRFVYLKKTLRHFIPPASTVWEEQIKRMQEIDSLKKTILSHINVYENDELRVFPKLQKDLWTDGYDKNNKVYNGDKWGKYLRARQIYFQVLEIGKRKFRLLEKYADIRFGIKTGANEFFYLSEDDCDKLKIEKEYLQPIIFSLKEIQKYKVEREELKKNVIICHKEKNKLRRSNLAKYIRWGESQNFHKRPTCSSRKLWYGLGEEWEYAPLIFPAKVGERMPVVLNDNIFEDKKLYGVIPKNKDDVLVIGALLNSTLTRLFIEYNCRQLTGAQAIADIDVNIVESLSIIDLQQINKPLRKKLEKSFLNLLDSKAESVFREIGEPFAEIDLSGIKQERRTLDKIVMGDIIGLSENEQIEVYVAVIDLVCSRLKKARSVNNNKKNKENINIETFISTVMSRIGDETLRNLYQKKVLSKKKTKKVSLPTITSNFIPHIDAELMGWRLYYSNKEFMVCETEQEARFIKIFLDYDLDEISIPEEIDYLTEIIPEFEKLSDRINEIIDESLETIYSSKLRNSMKHRLFREIMKT